MTKWQTISLSMSACIKCMPIVINSNFVEWRIYITLRGATERCNREVQQRGATDILYLICRDFRGEHLLVGVTVEQNHHRMVIIFHKLLIKSA
jgi:hypothetical protein